MTNMFNVQPKEMQGKVIIRTRESNLVKGATIQHVVRRTADDAVIINKMAEHTDIVKPCDMVAVMSAFVASVSDIIANGNAVRISGLGTFYLKAREKANEEGENEFDIGFTADGDLYDAAQKAKAELTLPSEVEPAIEKVRDINSLEDNGEIAAEGFTVLNGKRLRVAGGGAGGLMAGRQTAGDWMISGWMAGSQTDRQVASVLAGGQTADGQTSGQTASDETGIYMVPCDADGNYKKDMSDWVRADDRYIWRNYMTEVIFKVPKVTGTYRIGIVTKAPLNGSTREDKLLKHAKTGVSAVISVV